MKLETLYVRFFRSLNIDYLRKYTGDPDKHPWDVVGPENQYYPFVKLDLESDITTIVGTNEAGKTQVLAAVKCLLQGTGYILALATDNHYPRPTTCGRQITPNRHYSLIVTTRTPAQA